MKFLLPMLLVSCSSTKYWEDEDIKLYSDGFYHGCAYAESKKDMNLNGLVECANRAGQLSEYHRRIRVRK